MSWDDLSDSELRSRLVQRGVPIDEAYELVADRDRSPAARARISEHLAR